jgi:hypothetical protein
MPERLLHCLRTKSTPFAEPPDSLRHMQQAARHDPRSPDQSPDARPPQSFCMHRPRAQISHYFRRVNHISPGFRNLSPRQGFPGSWNPCCSRHLHVLRQRNLQLEGRIPNISQLCDRGTPMTERKQDNLVQDQNQKIKRPIGSSMAFTPPSEVEEAFLKRIEQASEGYDPKVIVGGPRNFAP